MLETRQRRPVPVTLHTLLSDCGSKWRILSVTEMIDFTERDHVHGLGESACCHQRQLCCIKGPDQDLLMGQKAATLE